MTRGPATTTGAPSAEQPGSPRPPSARHRLLYLLVGLLLAGALAAVLASTGTSSRPRSAATALPQSATLPGITPPTANLLSLSLYPGSSKAAPDFTLVDQNGRSLTLSGFRGKSVVLSFNDDQCTDVCTLLAEDVIRADQYLGTQRARQVVFLSVNVNPYFPGVAAVKQWTDDNDLAGVPNWYFGTASPAALESVWKDYGVYVGRDAATRTVTHSALLEFIDPAGRVRATANFGLNAVDVDPYSRAMAQAAVDLLPGPQRVVAGPQAPPPGGRGAGVGQRAPDFDLPALGGAGPAVDLSALHGQPVVLNFWASTCQNCREELKAFAEVAAAEPKVHFFGVDVADPSPSNALSLARAAGVPYPLLSDRGGQVAASYEVSGLPTTVYIDPAGHVAVVHPGAMTAEQLHYTLAQFFPDYASGGD